MITRLMAVKSSGQAVAVKSAICINLASIKHSLDLEKKKLANELNILKENFKSISYDGNKHYRYVTVHRGEIDPYTGVMHGADAPMTRKVEVKQNELDALKTRKEELLKLISLLDSANMPFAVCDNLEKTKSNIKMYKLAMSSYKAELNRVNSEIEHLFQNKKITVSERKAGLEELESKKEKLLNKLEFMGEVNNNINECYNTISYFNNKNLKTEAALSVKLRNYLEAIKSIWNNVN